MLCFAFSSQALTSQTSNTINGSAPYLTFDNGRTRVTSLDDELFKITLSNGSEITPATDSSSTIPIELPNANETFANIDTLIPAGSDSIALSSLIGAPNSYWRDDDGDDDFEIIGDLKLTITDKNNQVVARNAILDICNAPYKLTLSNENTTLKTRYGIPNGTDISARSVTYYINPKASPLVCFARPNLEHNRLVTDHNFDGPAEIWDPGKGFKPQASYGSNFPTTGANELYFYLDIGGVQPLVWEEVKHEGITVKAEYDRDHEGKIVNPAMVRVTLKGPAATDTQWKSDTPNTIGEPIGKPDLPQTFELVGSYSKGGPAIVKYGFKLNQWFVNRGDVLTYKKRDNTVDNTVDWCGQIGYKIPKVKDLTNSTCRGYGVLYYCRGAVGATPKSPDNFFTRVIGAGFFSEWGPMGEEEFYKDAGFITHGYWTQDVTPFPENAQNPDRFDVYSLDGTVRWNYAAREGAYELCVYPESKSDSDSN